MSTVFVLIFYYLYAKKVARAMTASNVRLFAQQLLHWLRDTFSSKFLKLTGLHFVNRRFDLLKRKTNKISSSSEFSSTATSIDGKITGKLQARGKCFLEKRGKIKARGRHFHIKTFSIYILTRDSFTEISVDDESIRLKCIQVDKLKLKKKEVF